MNRTCSDCGVKPGEAHIPGCDVARCTLCGWQRFSCDCGEEVEGEIWTGEWPGDVELREGLADDMNDLYRKAMFGLLIWNGQRFVRSEDAE